MTFFSNLEFKDILLFILVIFILCKIYQLEQKTNMVEGATGINDTNIDRREIRPLTQEALQSIATVYNDEELILPSLTIQGVLKVNGKIISDDLDVTGKTTSKDLDVTGKTTSKDLDVSNNLNAKNIYVKGTGSRLYIANDGMFVSNGVNYLGAGNNSSTTFIRNKLSVGGDTALQNTTITQRDTKKDALTIIPTTAGINKTHFYRADVAGFNTYIRGGSGVYASRMGVPDKLIN